LNPLAYLLLLAAAAFFFYSDIFFLGVACILLLVVFLLLDASARRRRAAQWAAAQARAAAQAQAEEEEEEEEGEEERILIRHKVGKIPPVMRLRIRPKSKRRSSWEMTTQDLGDIMDTVFGSVFRLVTGAHEHEAEKPWEAGRGR
jgi:flagellar biosynthesis/type III secretory pathway M-ring protein FliF/YscJ